MAYGYENDENAVDFLKTYKPILLTVTGSRLFGHETAKSDHDYLGVYIEPMQDVVGFSVDDTKTFRSAALRTGVNDAPSTKGDVDITLYGLRKFLRLFGVGNPNLTLMAYATQQGLVTSTEMGLELQRIAKRHLLSRNTLKATTHYTTNLLRKAMDSKDLDESNKIYANLSALVQFTSRMVDGYEDALILSSQYIQYNRDVRSGGNSTADSDYYVIKTLRNIEQKVQALGGNTYERDPEYVPAESWMLNTYKKAWGLHG